MKKVPVQTLSKRITSLLEAYSANERISINRLIERTEGRGLYLVMVLMCLPFVSPIPVPGLSNIVGIVMVIISVRLAFNLPPRLPIFIGGRHIPLDKLKKNMNRLSKLLGLLETAFHPRYSRMTTLPPVRLANAICFFVMGILLALPIPPVIPFSNSLPSWGILLVALASMERDGLMLWAGYAVSAGAFLYLAVFGGVVAVSLDRLFPFVY